jgi:hypothetical protein
MGQDLPSSRGGVCSIFADGDALSTDHRPDRIQCTAGGGGGKWCVPSVPETLSIRPGLINTTIYLDDDENVGQNETDTALEDKVQAYETLIVFASTLQAHFGPYVSQTLELAIRDGLSGKRDPFKTDEDGVRTWDPGYGWNEGLRESCAMSVSTSLLIHFELNPILIPLPLLHARPRTHVFDICHLYLFYFSSPLLIVNELLC